MQNPSFLKNLHPLFVVMKFFSFLFFQSVNLSYQDLGHPYQKKEFLRVLRRLLRCENLQLMENSIQDLSSVLLPRWVKLDILYCSSWQTEPGLQYFNINFRLMLSKVITIFVFFRCSHLYLQRNFITDLRVGVENFYSS